MLGVPVAAGVWVGTAGWRVDDIGNLIAGVSILTGFAFGLLMFVFQLRLSAAREQRVRADGELATLLNELFANVAYTTVLGLGTVGLLVGAGSLAPPPTDPPVVDSALSPLLSGLCVGLMLHFLLTLLMAVKRVWLAFQNQAKNAQPPVV